MLSRSCRGCCCSCCCLLHTHIISLSYPRPSQSSTQQRCSDSASYHRENADVRDTKESTEQKNYSKVTRKKTATKSYSKTIPQNLHIFRFCFSAAASSRRIGRAPSFSEHHAYQCQPNIADADGSTGTEVGAGVSSQQSAAVCLAIR